MSVDFEHLHRELLRRGHTIRPRPTRHGLLALVPWSPASLQVVFQNPHLATNVFLNLPQEKGSQNEVVIGLEIGSSTCVNTTLATIGRGEGCTIKLPESETYLSIVQCEFKIDEKQNMLYLYDRSSRGTTNVRGTAHKYNFDQQLSRVGLLPNVNDKLCFGVLGNNKTDYRFRMVWLKQKFNASDLISAANLNKPRNAVTVTPPVTNGYNLRIPLDRTQRNWDKYCDVSLLGEGGHGQVYKSINLENGRGIATKRTECKPDLFGEDSARGWAGYRAAHREIKTLQSLRHPNIINYISHKVDDRLIQLRVGLRDGMAFDLMGTYNNRVPHDIIFDMTCNMLLALSFLEGKGIIHFDVKPENVLFSTNQPSVSGYVFQLADFGLAGRPPFQCGFTRGTFLYQAPEVFHEGSLVRHHRQHNTARVEPPPTYTGKVDVWSLYVTLIQMMNLGSFHEILVTMGSTDGGHYTLEEYSRVQDLVQQSRSRPELMYFRDMAEIGQNRRKTASEMLDIVSHLVRHDGRNDRFLQYLRKVDHLKLNNGNVPSSTLRFAQGSSVSRQQPPHPSPISTNIVPARRQEATVIRSGMSQQGRTTALPRSNLAPKRALGTPTEAIRGNKSPRL